MAKPPEPGMLYTEQKPELTIHVLPPQGRDQGGRKGKRERLWTDANVYTLEVTKVSNKICTKRYLFSDKWISKQYFPWLKAGLMWQTFKNSSIGPVLPWEIITWVETSFYFRIQFCSTSWTDKIPKSQKCARLEQIRFSLQKYRARHKKIILTAVPNLWRMVYPKSSLLLLVFP